jgi:hypothetical protein
MKSSSLSLLLVLRTLTYALGTLQISAVTTTCADWANAFTVVSGHPALVSLWLLLARQRSFIIRYAPASRCFRQRLMRAPGFETEHGAVDLC